jgi:hypothetical protein
MKSLQDILFETVEKEWERALYIFDFDDTLVQTGSLIYVENILYPLEEFGSFSALTPAEFAVYEPREGDKFDFSDFRRLIDPQEISWTLDILRKVVSRHGKDAAVILTARGTAEPVREFLRDKGLQHVQVRALDDNHPERKSAWIAAVIKGLGLQKIEFFDDSSKNIEAVKKIAKDFPHVEFNIHHVTH